MSRQWYVGGQKTTNVLMLCLDKQAHAFETFGVESGAIARVKCAGKKEDSLPGYLVLLKSFGNERRQERGHKDVIKQVVRASRKYPRQLWLVSSSHDVNGEKKLSAPQAWKA